MQNKLMKYDPRTRAERPYPSHAAQFRKWHGPDAWLYNPWTGDHRHYSDIGTDPTGVMIDTGEPLISAEIKTPLENESERG